LASFIVCAVSNTINWYHWKVNNTFYLRLGRHLVIEFIARFISSFPKVPSSNSILVEQTLNQPKALGSIKETSITATYLWMIAFNVFSPQNYIFIKFINDYWSNFSKVVFIDQKKHFLLQMNEFHLIMQHHASQVRITSIRFFSFFKKPGKPIKNIFLQKQIQF